MIKIQDYPWYLQQTDANGPFVIIYDSLFWLVCKASPIGIGNFYNIRVMKGAALANLGSLFGLTADLGYSDGLVFNFDKWSTTKVWSGQVTEIGLTFYRRYIKMRGGTDRRPFSLNTIKRAMGILLSGYHYTVSVEESHMHFKIKLTSGQGVLETFQELLSYDPTFLGQLPGISYEFEYIEE